MWDTVAFNKSAALRMLRERGIASAVVTFSGGNDDGGVDSISFKMEDGTELENSVQRTHAQGWGILEETGKFGRLPDKKLSEQEVADNAFLDQLEAPVYSRYSSFAGEFYVYGEVIFDVASGKVAFEGKESVETYDDFSEEI